MQPITEVDCAYDSALDHDLPRTSLYQEEGRVGGREPLSVGLVCAFETERSLVLSIPAGSRTLREVGQHMHSERRSKKSRISDGGVFNDQVCHKTTMMMMICHQSKANARCEAAAPRAVGVDYPTTVARRCAA